MQDERTSFAAGASPARGDATTAGHAAWMITALAFATFGEGVLLGVVPAVSAALGPLFHASAGQLNWITTSQVLATVVCTPVLARLGDIHGHRRLLRIGVIIAVVGTVVCAIAPNFSTFITGRILEGTVAAFTALGIGIARDRLPTRYMRIAVAAIVATLIGGGAIGLLAAAELFSATSSVRAVLWIPAVLIAISLALLFIAVPETTRRAQTRMDWPGATALVAGLALLTFGLSEGPSWGWGSAAVIGLLAGGVVLVAGWAVIELRVSDPLIDLRVIAGRDMGPFYVASITLGFAFFGAQTATSIFLASPGKLLGYGFGLDITKLALVLLPAYAFSILGSAVLPRLVKLVGHKVTLYAGCLLMTVGYGWMAGWNDQLWRFILTNCIVYLGIGVVSGALPLVLAERAQQTATGITTGLFNTGKGIGGSLSGAIGTIILSAIVLPHVGEPRQSAFVVIWLACGAASLLSLAVVVLAAARSTATGRDMSAASAKVTSTERGNLAAG
jgi:MFS family permease